jgi:hypothetical protein
MFSKFLLAFATLSCSVFSVRAQELRNPFELAKGERRFIYGLDNRRTHIDDASTSIYGAYCGIGFSQRRLRFKFGLNLSEMYREKPLVNGTYQRNQMVFGSMGEEIDLFQYRKLRLISYINGGAGYELVRTFTEDGKRFGPFKRDWVFPLEPGLVLGYDIVPFLTLRLGGGWRMVFSDQAQNRLDGYFLKIGAQVHTREAIWSYRNWKKRNKSKASSPPF